MAKACRILLVEDNDDDVFLMGRALRRAGLSNSEICVVEDGQEAIDYLSGRGRFSNRAEYPIPSIVFLDLKLPLVSGHKVLSWIRQQPQFKQLPVVMLTSSGEPDDIARARELRADRYLVKPPKAEQLAELVKTLVPQRNSDPNDFAGRERKA